jgi:hypothetical protein
MLISFVSAKHSPGASLSALAFAVAARDIGDSYYAEMDPAGGEAVSYYFEKRVPYDPGLISLAAAARRGEPPPDILLQHSVELPAGVRGWLAPPSADQASGALVGLSLRLSSAYARMPGVVFADAGRWDTRQPSADRLRNSEMTIVALRPTVSGVEHVRSALNSLSTMTTRIALLLVGDRPYSPGEVAAALNVDVLGSIDYDPRGAQLIQSGAEHRAIRRTALVRSAATLVDQIRARLQGINPVVPSSVLGSGVKDSSGVVSPQSQPMIAPDDPAYRSERAPQLEPRGEF